MVFNNWFHQGFIPDQISRDVIKLLKKDKSVGRELDGYRPITLLNTALKIRAKILCQDSVETGTDLYLEGPSNSD